MSENVEGPIPDTDNPLPDGIGGDPAPAPTTPEEAPPPEPDPVPDAPPPPAPIAWEPATWYSATFACLTVGCPNQNVVKTMPKLYSNNGDPKYIRIVDSVCGKDCQILTATKLDPQPVEE